MKNIFDAMTDYLKAMTDYLPHLSLLLISLGAILTVAGGFLQYVKEKKSDHDAAIRDSITIQNHIDLQNRSNNLLDSTEKVLNDTKSLLESNQKVLEDTKTLIEGSEELQIRTGAILGDTKVLLEGSNKITQQNIAALRHLDGSSQTPKLIAKISDIYSISLYVVTFHLQNLDDYPIKELEVSIESDDQLRLFNIEKMTGGFYDLPAIPKVKRIYDHYQNRSINRSTFLLSPHSTKIVHESFFLFNQPSAFYKIRIKWGKGQYEALVRLKMDNNLFPSIKPGYIIDSHTTLRIGPGATLGSDQYFEFDNLITDTKSTLERIRRHAGNAD